MTVADVRILECSYLDLHCVPAPLIDGYSQWTANFLFAVKIGEGDCEVGCQSWTTKMPKAAQPNLNYIGEHKSQTKPLF